MKRAWDLLAGDDFVFDSELSELSASPKTQLLHESVLVKFHGPRGQIQNCRSLLGGTSLCQKLKDLALPRRELP
jgi:hypothetical protein